MDFKNLKLLMSVLKNNKNSTELQSTLNNLVDATILEAKRHNNGTFKLPDIRETFNEDSSWKPCGKFHASNGEFADLTTLTRADDVHITRAGRKFEGSCSIRLLIARAHYKRYSLRYGVEVKGTLTTSVDGITLNIKIMVNWKKRRLTIQDVQITHVGKIKIHLTGLGPLNIVASKLISWITVSSKETIIEHIQKLLRERIEESFSQINF